MPAVHIDQGVYEYLKHECALLLDVRTPAEYIQGHIPGSTNIPLHAIEDVEFMAESKEDPLYVYCHTGVRSRLAVDQLQEMGYRNARNIGGIAAYTGKLAV